MVEISGTSTVLPHKKESEKYSPTSYLSPKLERTYMYIRNGVFLLKLTQLYRYFNAFQINDRAYHELFFSVLSNPIQTSTVRSTAFLTTIFILRGTDCKMRYTQARDATYSTYY